MDKIQKWLQSTLYSEYTLTVASADASFRTYYRLTKGKQSYILMDSSLELESLKPFVKITKLLRDVGVKAPKIFAQNLPLGYLILQDFGNQNLLDTLNRQNFKKYYSEAMDEIVSMQQADASKLPLYEKTFLHFEMDLMKEWYLQKKLQVSLNVVEEQLIQKSLNVISEIVLEQPQNLFVHRDFHSRNIMLTPNGTLGVIDYQDAMSGAITYDLVSLLKDCYIEFPRKDIEELVLEFRDKLGLDVSDEQFIKWFDFMGLQRHIKVLGIFSRLHLRDGKDGYLKDIPLTLKYTIETALRYEETQELGKLLQELT
jgi:aminoglycoside/choline kinase family phosphotransferase